MCGRYTLSSPADLVADFFDAEEAPELAPRYNVAPTQEAPIVRDGDGGRRIELARWGLVPYWAKDAKIGNRMINARAETVADKPAYRRSFRSRRCLVAADGFYEWQKTASGPRQPWYFRPADAPLFGLAGLWDRWRGGDGEAMETFTILTTDANALVAEAHHRMPVILDRGDFALWLDPAVEDPARLAPLLRPLAPEKMASWPVSTFVNSPANDSPRCVEPVA